VGFLITDYLPYFLPAIEDCDSCTDIPICKEEFTAFS